MNVARVGRGEEAAPEKSGSSAIVDKVIRQIDRMIGGGELQLGDSLSEPSLCTAMGVGRVPVREAIRILAGEGVLELVPHRSARVRMASAREIVEMMEVLNSFSVLAVHLICAAPADPNLIERLAETAESIKNLAKNKKCPSGDILKAIRLYHLILIEGSGNEYLETIIRRSRMHYYSRYLIEILGRYALIEAAPTYAKITAAIARGDPQTAIRILFNQVENSKSHAKLT